MALVAGFAVQLPASSRERLFNQPTNKQQQEEKQTQTNTPPPWNRTKKVFSQSKVYSEAYAYEWLFLFWVPTTVLICTC